MMGLLLYGVTRGGTQAPPDLNGVLGAPVRHYGSERVVLLASEYDGEEITPRRRNLAEFQGVINGVAAAGDILPCGFGMLARSEDEVVDLVRRNREVLEAELERIAGRREYTLRMRWKGDSIFAHFLERFEVLRAFRDRCFADGRTPTHDERIQLGQLFERHLQAERARVVRLFVDTLAGCIDEWQELGYPDESTLCSLALLVDRGRSGEIDAGVEGLAGAFDDQHVIELTGPTPPYSFAELRLE